MRYGWLRNVGIALLVGIGCYLVWLRSDEPASEPLEAPATGVAQWSNWIAQIRGGAEAYPHGHFVREYDAALQRQAKRGQVESLPWVSRGPANVGGRTRALLFDPADPTGHTWYAGAVTGGLWRGIYSEVNGRGSVEWTSLTDDLPNLTMSSLAIPLSDPNVLYVGTGEAFHVRFGGDGIYKSVDRGRTWVQLPQTSSDTGFRYVNRLLVHPDNADVLVAATNAGLYRTTDGGLTFEQVYSGWVQDVRAHPDHFETQFATERSRAVLRSLDGGQTWERVFTGGYSILGDGWNRKELAISPSHPNVVYFSVNLGVRDGCHLFRSTNSGTTWLPVVDDDHRLTQYCWMANPWSQGHYNQTLAVHPLSPDTVYLGGIYLIESWITGTDTLLAWPTRVVNQGTDSFWDPLWFLAPGEERTTAYLEPDYDPEEFINIARAERFSAVVLFGQGGQRAHRFTVPEGSEGGVPLREYRYEDYVEVPFQAWDLAHQQQLMVSFRDQAGDSTFNLERLSLNSDPDRQSREYIFIHKYPYDSTQAHGQIAQDGGLAQGTMYGLAGVLERNAAGWDPEALPPSRITLYYQPVPQRRVQGWGSFLHVDHHNIQLLPKEDGTFQVLNANDGGVAYSPSRRRYRTWYETQSGNGWRELPGYITTQFYDVDKRSGVDQYVGGTQDNGTYLSPELTSNTDDWDRLGGGDGMDVFWAPGSGDSLIMTQQDGIIYRFLDGGQTRESMAGKGLYGAPPFWTTLGTSLKRPETIFTVRASGVWRTQDFAETWELIPMGERWWYLSAPLKYPISVSLADPDIVWVGGTSNRLYVSDNGGDAFEMLIWPGRFPSFLSGLATHPHEPHTAFALSSYYGRPKVWRTRDLGVNWEELSGFGDQDESRNGFPDIDVYDLAVMPHDPRIIWVGTTMGIFESTDHGASWHYANNGLPAVPVYRIKIRDNQIILATHGRGIWTLDAPLVTARETDPPLPLLVDALEPNYPNPFNPTTTLRFTVASDQHVTISIYDVLGRRVAVLTDQPYAQGTHTLQWQAQGFASGTYYARMIANGQVIDTRSLILVK